MTAPSFSAGFEKPRNEAIARANSPNPNPDPDKMKLAWVGVELEAKMAVQRHAASRHAANERENDGSSEVSGIPSMVLSAFSQATKSVGRSVGRWRAGKRIPFGPAVRWPPLPSEGRDLQRFFL